MRYSKIINEGNTDLLETKLNHILKAHNEKLLKFLLIHIGNQTVETKHVAIFIFERNKLA